MKALDAATASRIDGDRLQLLDGNRTVLAEFTSGFVRFGCDDGQAVLIHDDNSNPQQGWTATGGSTFERFTSSLGRSYRGALLSKVDVVVLEGGSSIRLDEAPVLSLRADAVIE